jgi:SAM-dependent methyltransferase
VASQVVGVDHLLADLSALKESSKLGSLVCADVETLPLKDESIEVAVLGDVIEHVNNPGLLLRSIHRCLRKDGEIVVTTPNPFYVNQFIQILTSNSISVNPDHCCWYDPATLAVLLRRHGFAITEFHWLHDSWGEWEFRNWFTREGTLATKIYRVLVAPVFVLVGAMRILRHLRSYFSSDFAIVARKRDG